MARLAGFAIALGGVIAIAFAIGPRAHATRPAASTTATRPTTAPRPTSAPPRTTEPRPSKANGVAKAGKPRHAARTSHEIDPHLSSPSDAVTTPAYHYAQLSQADCEAELVSRHIDFIRETATGVLAPVRLTGRLHGVEFRSNASAKVRATSRYEIVDCRLVLALYDFAQILSDHGIVEVRHYSMYRPPKSAPDGEIGKRHSGALAIDTGRFIDSAGAELDVDRDFHGAIDARTCGEGAAPDPPTAAALALRAILCETVERRLFNVVLTPNYNRPHKNHFHLELTAGVGWFLVH